MAYEPWYQTTSPSKDDVIRSVNADWFIVNLNKKENTYTENTKLRLDTSSNATFEEIRMATRWKDKCDCIIEEEFNNVYNAGIGSYRGYSTFVHKPLCNIIMRRIISEIWSVYKIDKILQTIVTRWLKARYAPGGNGYLVAESNFKSNVTRMIK
jgi:hypothetical protein